MCWINPGGIGLQRHKVFLSYYHRDDQYYKNLFENKYKHLFINKSVGLGDISTDVSTEYIKRLIQQDYISDSSVLVVLIGPNTWGRKHVDWEIYAAVNKKVGGYSGLLGILLPEFQLLPNGNYYFKDIPPRLADNVQSGYATVYTWNQLCFNDNNILEAIHTAFQNRVQLTDRIVNSRVQFSNNRSGV